MTEASGTQRFFGSLKVHLRLIVIAVALGLLAYGGIHLMIWLFKSIGLM